MSVDFARVTSVSEASGSLHAGGLVLNLTNGGELVDRAAT